MSSEEMTTNLSSFIKNNNNYSGIHFDNYVQDSLSGVLTQDEYVCQCKNCQKQKFSGWLKFAIIFSTIILILGAAAGTIYAFYPQIKSYFINLVEKNIDLPVYDMLEIMMFESMNSPIPINDEITYANNKDIKNYQDSVKETFYFNNFFNLLKKQIDTRLSSYFVSDQNINIINNITNLIKVNEVTNTYDFVNNFQDLMYDNLINYDESSISGHIQILIPENHVWNIISDVFIYLTVSINLK